MFPPLAHRSLRSYCVVVFTLHGIVRMRARPRVCVRAQALSGLGFRVWAVADAKKLRLTFAHGPAAPAPPPLA